MYEILGFEMQRFSTIRLSLIQRIIHHVLIVRNTIHSPESKTSPSNDRKRDNATLSWHKTCETSIAALSKVRP
jgi:hypothetical protein